MLFDDVTAATLVSALRGYEARNLAISNNLANAETPGYQRLDVSFEETLAEASREAHGVRGGGMGGGSRAEAASLLENFVPQATAEPGAMRADGGSVDPDTEMAALAQNQLAHQTVTSLLDKHLTLIRTAIIGR
ncbi:MAG: flagellar basal body rod protein FlgB [Miltoncostaeaceae bacterium]